MRKPFVHIITSILLLAGFLVGCNPDDGSQVSENHLVVPVMIDNCHDDLACAESEEMTISVPIQEHEIRIVRHENEQKQAKLSDANVKELESWWDSLPNNVQTQIKANQIDIEVVSNIRTNNKNDINPTLNDSQVENTGETLEQIIGKETDMRYTVSTTLLDGKKTGGNGEHATNIRLVKQVPVKLQQFTTDIFLREKEVSNDNIRTLQYWWNSLPEDIRTKIKNRELVLDVACHTVNDIDMDSEIALAAAEEYAAIMGDILNRLVGVYKAGKKEISLAKIKTLTKMEAANERTLKLPAKQFVKVSLRKNKAFIPSPL